MFDPDLPCMADPDLFTNSRKVDKARKICAACKEQPTCLENAMEFQRISGEPLQGVVAGFLPDERTKIYLRRTA